jgi:hypothetical protein
MADVTVSNTGLPSPLMDFLQSEAIEPGSPVGYQTCKAIFEFHPLAPKIIEKPIVLALAKPRLIAMDCHPKEMLIKAFQEEWDRLDATNIIRDVTFLKRVYGVAAVVYGAEGIPTDQEIDPWKLPDLNIYFNKLDPLNLAGSTVTNQNPNAPDFQKPLQFITAAGQPYHPSRSCIVYNNTPIYLAYQPSGFGFTGRSVFQRALYPLKSFVQSMVTDDLVTFKAGLLVIKQKQSGSIVNRLMQTAAGIKRSYLQQGTTGNVLSIDINEDIESIDLNNTDTAMTTARDNIIANIAAATDVPAILLKDEALANSFAEGSQDAIAIAQYVTGLRNDMRSLFTFFDKIVMHRAWNKQFFEAVQNKYPEMYSNKTYEQAFYEWKDAFTPTWDSMIEETPSELVKTEEVKLKGMTEMLRTLLPVINPENRARAIQWAQDNLSEMNDMFTSSMQLDIEEIMDYEPPEPLTAPTEPPHSRD